MNQSNEEFVVKYCNSNSILVINTNGKLKQVFTPFCVTAKEHKFGKIQSFIVEEVLSTAKDELVYIINGKPYFQKYFLLTIHF